jgi:hypothetical protein
LWCTGGVNRKIRESKRHREHLKKKEQSIPYYFLKLDPKKKKKFFRIWSGTRSLAVEKG